MWGHFCNGAEVFPDQRFHCFACFIPQNFYKHEVDRQEMYIRYLYKLKDLHQQSGNHTEAAFTLLLHGELLDWTNQLLPDENDLPMEYAWKRKERLYLQVINLFDRGEVCVVLPNGY